MDEEKFFQKCVKNQTFPSNDALKQIILKRVTKEFEDNKIYSEQEVNESIKKFFKDYILIRRELINFGYIQRDPYKSQYWVVKRKLTREDYEKISRLKIHAKEVGFF